MGGINDLSMVYYWDTMVVQDFGTIHSMIVGLYGGYMFEGFMWIVG